MEEIKEAMSKDFTNGYNEAIRDILNKNGMWVGVDPELLKKLKEVLN